MYAKSNAQHGRRTPLSLNAGSAKQQQHNQQHQNKPAAGANGNSNAVHTKNDNKSIHQKTEEPTLAELKETIQKDAKRQQNQQTVEKKQQQHQQNANESAKKNVDKNEEKKTLNGNLGKNNVNAKEKQQQQQQKQPNTEENVIDTATKDKKEKVEKVDKNEKVEKNEKPAKDEKKETEDKSEKVVEKKEKEMEKKPEKDAKQDGRKKQQEKLETQKIEVSKNEEKAVAATAVPATPTKPTVEPKTVTPRKPTTATPTKAAEKIATIVSTIVIDDNNDIEMETLEVENSPVKHTEPVAPVTALKPAATSTPGKGIANKHAAKSEVQLAVQTGGSPDRSSCPRTYTQISGRRSIRPISDYTTSHFQSNLHFRESYRRINTELDVTSTTNTSLNVTVGSEVPNNSSFSFFGRGRKRDRTPPKQSQSAIELQTDLDTSPPKRARLDMQGFLSVVSSPLSLLRSRFSKTSIQSSTPVKLRSKLAAEDEESEVQNVSGISINEEIANGDSGDEITATGEEVKAVGDETPKKGYPSEGEVVGENSAEKIATEKMDVEKCGLEQATATDGDNNEDIKIKETPLTGAANDPLVKNKRCSIM